jgi:hypothetical protein
MTDYSEAFLKAQSEEWVQEMKSLIEKSQTRKTEYCFACHFYKPCRCKQSNYDPSQGPYECPYF